jgi:molybdopterin molybdotransferase
MWMQDISFEEALQATLNSIHPLPPIEESIEKVAGHVLAHDQVALVDSPTADISLRDGFALISSDVKKACSGQPVSLRCLGRVEAGSQAFFELKPQTCVEVFTGACIPAGADAVLPFEYTRRQNDIIWCLSGTEPGRYIFRKGSDLKAGEVVGLRQTEVSPAMAGLLAAAGIHRITIYPFPTVSIIATGDELVYPGGLLRSGQVYASNLVTLISWLNRFGISGHAQVAPDSKTLIRAAIEKRLEESQVIVTSGGTAKSERDVIADVLNEMGWEAIFHRIRMWPGKGTCFGILKGKPVFCLPGTPSATEMVFLTLVLPALLAMSGMKRGPFLKVDGRLKSSLSADSEWSSFYQAKLFRKDGEIWVEPLKYISRLKAMAESQAIIQIPAGHKNCNRGDYVPSLLLSQSY